MNTRLINRIASRLDQRSQNGDRNFDRIKQRLRGIQSSMLITFRFDGETEMTFSSLFFDEHTIIVSYGVTPDRQIGIPYARHRTH